MIVSQMMKKICCKEYKQDCDKCNLHYGCDRVKLKECSNCGNVVAVDDDKSPRSCKECK